MMKRWISIAKNCSSREFSTSTIPKEKTSSPIPFTLVVSTCTGFMGFIFSDLVQSKIDQRRFKKIMEENRRLEKLDAELRAAVELKAEVLRKTSGRK